MVKRQKKISFRFFLNEDSEPIGRKKEYFLFARINFNTNNTTIRLQYLYTIEKFNENFKDNKDTNNLHEGDRLKIETALRYEYNLLGERHTLKGFGRRFYNIYTNCLNVFFDVPSKLSGPANLPETFDEYRSKYFSIV